jgi:ribose-phosphate pyrophosphokinase
MNDPILFSGTSNPTLSRDIAAALHTRLGSIEITRFIDSECRVYVKENVTGKHAVVIQSLSQIADQNLVELCLIGEALKALGVINLTAVIPWLGYSKQDRAFRRGEAVSAHLVAKFIETAGFESVITVELHSETVIPYFTVPIKELSTHDLLAASLPKSDYGALTVASPDQGGKSRSEKFTRAVGLPIVYLEKSRNLHTGVVSVTGISDAVGGRHVVIFDDIINTGETAVKTSAFLKRKGARSVTFLATHAVLAGNAPLMLANSAIDRIVVADTIEIPKVKIFPKLEVVSVAPLLAGAIHTAVNA